MGEPLEQIVNKPRASGAGEVLVKLLDFIDGGVTTTDIHLEYTDRHNVLGYLRFLEDKHLISKDKKYQTTGLHKQIAEEILPYALEIMFNPKRRGKHLIKWDILLRLAEPANISSIFVDLGMSPGIQRGYLNDLVEQGYIAEIRYAKGVYYQRTAEGDSFIQSVRTVLKEKFDYEDKRSVKVGGKKKGERSSYVGETLNGILEYAISGAKKGQISISFGPKHKHYVDFLVKHGLLERRDDEKYYSTKLYSETDKDILSYALGILFDPERRGGGLAYYDVLSEFSPDEPRTIGNVYTGIDHNYLNVKREALEMAKVGHIEPLNNGRRTYYTYYIRTPKGETFLARIDSLVETLTTVAGRQAA